MNAYRLNKFWWFTGALGLILIAVGSLIPSTPGEQLIPHFDKLLHFTGYATASFYFQQLTKNKSFLKVFSFIFLYSALIELLQDQLPTRQMSGLDLVANGAGAIFGTLLSLFILKDLLTKIDHTLSNQLSQR